MLAIKTQQSFTKMTPLFKNFEKEFTVYLLTGIYYGAIWTDFLVKLLAFVETFEF
jgi:hypothetical protein